MIFTNREYEQYSLKELAEWLNTGYYSDLSLFCSLAADKLSALSDHLVHENMHIYTRACSRVLDRTNDYINNGNHKLVEYIQQLQHKIAEGHNCATCSGSCSVQHSSYVTEILVAGNEINALLYDLHRAGAPFRVNPDVHLHYAPLRNDMFVVDTMLRKLFFIEETVLVPKLLQAQKNINVRVS